MIAVRSAKASIVELDKGKRYRVFVEAGRDPNTGKRIRLTRTVRGGRKAAEEAKAELLAMAGESSAARADITLESFWSEMYLPGCEARLRPTTVSGYKKDYKTYVKGPLGGLKLSRLTPVVVSRWLDGIPDAVKKHRACKMLKMILARAVKLDLMDYNPCDRVELPKRRRYRPEVLDAAQAERYLEEFRGTVCETAVLIALGGGLRRSELVALDWDDVSREGAVRVHHAVTVVDGRPHDDATKTEFSERTVHLPASVAARLNELRMPRGPVVRDSNGNRFHPDALTRAYIRIRDKMPEDLPRVSLKNLRHSSLTILVDSGADLLAASRRAGHSDVSITSAYYVRPHDVVDKNAAEMMERAFGGGGGE